MHTVVRDRESWIRSGIARELNETSFLNALQRAQEIWSSPDSTFQPITLEPLRIIGSLRFLGRRADSRRRREIQRTLPAWIRKLNAALQSAGTDVQGVILRALDRLLFFAESLVSEIEATSAGDLRGRLSLAELDDDFFWRVEDAFYVLEGIDASRLEVDESPFKSRLAQLRRRWDESVDKVAEAFVPLVVPSRLLAMEASPSEFWWERKFASAVRARKSSDGEEVG